MYTLKQIRIDGFPKSLGHLRKRYVTVRVDQGETWTSPKLGINEGVLAWTELKDFKQFEASPTSIFELKLFEASLAGGKGKEVGSCTQSIQLLLDSPDGWAWPLLAKTQKATLNVTLGIVKAELPIPQEDSEDGKPDDGAKHDPELGKVVSEAQEALSAMHQARDRPALNTTIKALQSASQRLNDKRDTWQPLLDKLDGFMNLVDGIAEIHPYAKMAWSVVSSAYKIYKNQKDRDEKVNDLATAMEEAYDTIMAGTTLKELVRRAGTVQIHEVQQADRRHTDVLQRLSIQTVECGHFIAKYAKDRSFFMRAGKQILGNPKTTIDRFVEAFEKLQQAFEQQAVVSTEIMVVRALQSVRKIEMTTDLSGLMKVYVEGAGCNSQKQCLAGTRMAALDEISEWINCAEDNTPRVRLLLGLAGTGKSTIAHTVAYRFRRVKRLGAAFCFSSSRTQQSQHALATLAVDLASFDPVFKEALWRGVGQDIEAQTTADLSSQFENFILKPAAHMTITGCILIMFDGLDEIGDVHSRAPFLRVLSEHLRRLPPEFRVLLTARPELDICALFKPESGVAIQHVNTTQTDPRLQADIQLFIRTELTKPDLGIHDLTETNYETLTERSEGLFQWARVACDFIIGTRRGGEYPSERYEDLMRPQEDDGHEGGKTNVLDDLYRRVLPRLIDLEDDRAKERFQRVMGLVLNAVEPLTMEAVQGLGRHVPLLVVNSKRDDVTNILSQLGSLLSGVSELKTPVRPLHTSFRDFLTTESRAKKGRNSDMIVDCHIGHTNVHHATLARACLLVLNSELHFNMCHLETSYRLNRDIVDLNARLEARITSALSYAAQFWGQHMIRESSMTVSLLNDVEKLLEINFLFWLELMSLLGAINSAAWALSSIISLIKTQNTKLAELATGRLRFVRNLARPISESAAHVYISGLSNAPKSSLAQRHRGRHYSRIVQICGGQKEDWPVLHNTLRGHSNRVISVAFSHDGKRIVSGSEDNTIRIWDAETGEIVGAPLKGHTGAVRSVAFSPDGKRLVSGASDNTIRIWDGDTGESLQTPLKGDGSWEASVSFSPDGKWIMCVADQGTIQIWDAETGEPVPAPMEDYSKPGGDSTNGRRIVFGARDNTIRIWDAQTGAPVREPLEGYSSTASCVAISPDGKWIASGSRSDTLEIWDVEKGQPVRTQLEGESNSVISVAFSPDGKHIVSSARDETLRIWETATGEPARAPLQGHRDLVLSVAFSPDGKRIVSGSYDHTVRIWDAEIGVSGRAPPDGHSDSVVSAAFLADGKQSVPGAGYSSIRIWDAETGPFLRGTLDGHSHWVFSVAFSPNGRQIVSGSHDDTIRIWDAETGKLVSTPLVGHRNSVRSVAFSPDGKRILSGSSDTTIRLWDAETGKPVGSPLVGHRDYVNSVAFSPDSKWIASGSFDTTIRIWDAETGALVRVPMEGHNASVNTVAFSPDGRKIVSGSADNTIRIWDTDTGELVRAPLKGHDNSVISVAFSPDGAQIVSGSQDNTLVIWDAETGQRIRAPLLEHSDLVWSVALSPDGQRIVSGSEDHTVRLWDSETGEPVGAPLLGHSDKVSSVAFSPDGKRIVSGSYDNTIRIWDAETGVPVRAALEGPGDSVCAVAFPPEDPRIISGLRDGNRVVWDAKPSKALEVGLDSEDQGHSVSAVTLPLAIDGEIHLKQESIAPSKQDSAPPCDFTFCPDIHHQPVQPYVSPDFERVRVSVNHETGWITCNESDHLFWLPPEQLKYLRTPGCRLVIPASKMVTLDMSRFVHGSRWTECYQPEP